MGLLDSALTKSNPLVRGVFVQNTEGEDDVPPPSSKFMITEISSNQMISEVGNNMVTE